MSSSVRWRGLVPVILGVVVILALAGCGSSSSSSSSASSSAVGAGSSTGAIPAATQSYYNTNIATPTSVGIGGPLTKKPPTGLKVDFLACALPTCEQQAKYFAQAVAHLGWTVKTVVFQSSAEGIQSAFNTAVADKPSGGVVTSGFLKAAFAPQLAKLKAENVPVVDYFSGNEAGDGIISAVGNEAILKFSDNMASWVTVQSQNKGTVMEFNVPSFGVQAIMHNRLKQDFNGKFCTGCHYSYDSLALTDIGPALPAKVVNAVQRTSGTAYLVFGFSELTTGVPAALANAGLTSRAKIITAGPEQPTFQSIMNGQIAAATAQPLEEQQWCLADALARDHSGATVNQVACDLPSQILTKANVTAAWPVWPGVPNWKATFLKDWLVP